MRDAIWEIFDPIWTLLNRRMTNWRWFPCLQFQGTIPLRAMAIRPLVVVGTLHLWVRGRTLLRRGTRATSTTSSSLTTRRRSSSRRMGDIKTSNRRIAPVGSSKDGNACCNCLMLIYFYCHNISFLCVSVPCAVPSKKKITFLVRIKVGINNFCFGLFESFKRKKWTSRSSSVHHILIRKRSKFWPRSTWVLECIFLVYIRGGPYLL